MTDRIYPSSKPTTANGNGASANGTSAAHPPPTSGGPALAPSKAQLYRPYNPPPSQQRRHGRRRTGGCRCTLCRCCFWTVLFILLLLLLGATVSSVIYLLYHPQKPSFAVSDLQIARLNLSSAATSSSLSAFFNLTLHSKNPNSHTFTYFFDATIVSVISSSSVLLGNSSLPAFVSFPKNQTNFKNIIATGEFQDLDTDTVTALRSDLRRRNGVPLTVQLDTKISVKAGGMKSKKVGIRISCNGFRGVVPPKGKAATVASVGESKCKADLRIKIWKFTF